MGRHGVVLLAIAASERLKLVDVGAGAVRKGGLNVRSSTNAESFFKLPEVRIPN